MRPRQAEPAWLLLSVLGAFAAYAALYSAMPDCECVGWGYVFAQSGRALVLPLAEVLPLEPGWVPALLPATPVDGVPPVLVGAPALPAPPASHKPTP